MSAPVQSIADVLDSAADLLEPEGAWIQGKFRDGGCWCALGAVAEVSGVNPWADQTWSGGVTGAAHAVLKQVIGSEWVDDWNDATGRTQQEVVAKLREAAALAREQGK